MKYKRTEEQEKAINAFVPVDEYMTSDIRRTCRAGFKLCAERLVSIGAGEAPDTTPFASIRAIDILGKYSMGKQPKALWIDNREILLIIIQLVAKYLNDNKKYEAFSNELQATIEEMI